MLLEVFILESLKDTVCKEEFEGGTKEERMIHKGRESSGCARWWCYGCHWSYIYTSVHNAVQLF